MSHVVRVPKCFQRGAEHAQVLQLKAQDENEVQDGKKDECMLGGIRHALNFLEAG